MLLCTIRRTKQIQVFRIFSGKVSQQTLLVFLFYFRFGKQSKWTVLGPNKGISFLEKMLTFKEKDSSKIWKREAEVFSLPLKKNACSVSAGFYLKLGGLNSRHLFLKVLEVGSPRSRCWHTVSGENCFLACRQLPLSVCSHGLFSVYAPIERALLSLPILFCPFLKL